MIKIKTGFGISILKQIKYVLDQKYGVNKTNEIWLSIKPRKNGNIPCLPNIIKNYFPVYLKYVDKIVGLFLVKFLSTLGFDGYIANDTYHPYDKDGYFGEEIILYDPTILERDTTNIYDWYMWKDYLPFKLDPKLKLYDYYSRMNLNFRFQIFYVNHKINSSKNINLIKNIQMINNKISFITINIHKFGSINKNISYKKSLKYFITLLKNFNPNIVCMEEYDDIKDFSVEYFTHNISNLGYKIYYRNGKSGLCLISNINIINVINKQYNNTFFGIREYVLFTVFDRLCCFTHLDIGKRYITKDKILKNYKELYKTRLFNEDLRESELLQLFKDKPSIILGDFNFNKGDAEYKFIKKLYINYNENIQYTVPFGTVVDFVFVSKLYNIRPLIYDTIDYNQSDHLPILCIFDKNTFMSK
jgi:endonuclease/exonuclease/phosphatase family metal-dependent hydrolase